MPSMELVKIKVEAAKSSQVKLNFFI